MTRLPRVLYAVPPLQHVHLEIAKAIQTLAGQGAFEKSQRPSEAQPQSNAQKLVADVVREFLHELRKAGFNPNEPRVPASNPDGGQWTAEGGGNPSAAPRAVMSDATPDNNWTPGAQYAANDPPGIGHNQGPPLEEPPEIPPRVLATKQAINDFLKAAAYWLEEASSVDKPAATLFFIALMSTAWLANKYLPYIITYQASPRTLQELQQAAQLPKIEYYNDHHLVEQTAAENDGFRAA
ncbi:MAG TPA: hypothetical protein VGG45_04520 [Terracidiphilus sp.]